MRISGRREDIEKYRYSTKCSVQKLHGDENSKRSKIWQYKNYRRIEGRGTVLNVPYKRYTKMRIFRGPKYSSTKSSVEFRVGNEKRCKWE